MKFVSPHTPRLDDPQAERVRRQHESAITELQGRPGAQLDVIAGVELANGIATPIAHKLGRPPIFVRESCVRGATSTGRVEEVRTSTYDRSRVVVLKATGYGGPIIVDVMVI